MTRRGSQPSLGSFLSPTNASPTNATADAVADAFEQAPIAIAVLRGTEGVCTAANRRFRAFCGARPVLGRSVHEAFPELHAGDLHELMGRALHTGQPAAGAERAVLLDRNLDGTPEQYFLNVVFQPLHDVAGVTNALALFATDVSAYVRAREDAERLRDTAAARQRAQSELLSVVSHELRTPLNAVAGYAELLDRDVAGALSPGQRDYVNRIRRAAEHLTRLTNDITDFAQLERGWVRMGRERAPLAPVVQAAHTLVETGARDRGVALRMPSAAAAAVPYVGDELRVRQILVNLLANALKATPRGGVVSVEVTTTDAPPAAARLQSTGPWAVVRVADTGCGLDTQQAATIFAPLMRPKARDDARGDGAGIGLMVSRRLARLMGGDLVLARAGAGEGAAFELLLPSADEAIGSRAFTDLEGDAAPPLGALGGDARALETLGEQLHEEVEPVLAAFAERVGADPATRRAARSTARGELAAYHGALLNAAIRSLALHAEGTGARRRVAREARLMQRVLAQYHGELRRRQGWTAQEVSREYVILGEEVAAAIRRHPEAGAAAEGAAEVLHDGILTARDAAVAAVRQPTHGAHPSLVP